MASRPSTLLAAAALTLSLAACGSGSSTGQGSADGSSASTAEAGGGGFPATVTTAFGEVTIEQQPERVVALGWGDAETALALGTQPVGASDWLGFGGEGVGPWAEGMYDSAPTIIETMEPSYEQIAALQPDLILDVRSSGDQARYDRLSEIAPTVGVPEGGQNYLTESEDQLDMIAEALGATERADELQDEVDQQFDEAREAHPDWQGKTASVATKTADGWGAYVDGDTRLEFMKNLGFSQNPAVAEMAPNATGFSVSLSAENLNTVEADAVVAFPIFIETSQLTGDAAWQALPAVSEGRAVVVEGDLSQAFSLGTTMATSYAIKEMVPRLESSLGQ